MWVPWPWAHRALYCAVEETRRRCGCLCTRSQSQPDDQTAAFVSLLCTLLNAKQNNTNGHYLVWLLCRYLAPPEYPEEPTDPTLRNYEAKVYEGTLPAPVNLCQPLPTPANPCQPRQPLPALVNPCQPAPALANPCQPLSALANPCQRRSTPRPLCCAMRRAPDRPFAVSPIWGERNGAVCLGSGAANAGAA